MIAVVGFGFAAFALAGGFIAQTFEALEEGTIRSVGHLQIVDRRAVGKAEEATLEFGIPDARRARVGRGEGPGRPGRAAADRFRGARHQRHQVGAVPRRRRGSGTRGGGDAGARADRVGPVPLGRRRRGRRARHGSRGGAGGQAGRPNHAHGDDAGRVAQRRRRRRRGPGRRQDQGAQRPVPRRRNRSRRAAVAEPGDPVEAGGLPQTRGRRRTRPPRGSRRTSRPRATRSRSGTGGSSRCSTDRCGCSTSGSSASSAPCSS